jgi:hypothetical protein
MKCKQKDWLASPMWRSTFKLTAGTMAMIAVCTLVMSLTACGSKSDADEEYDRVGMKAVIKDVYPKGEEVFDYRIVRKNDGEVWYTFVVNGKGNPADYKYHFSQNHVEHSFGHYNSWNDYGIWLFNEEQYKAYLKTKNSKLETAARVSENGIDILPNTAYYLRFQPYKTGTFDPKLSCTRKEVNGSNATTVKMPIVFYSASVDATYERIRDKAGKYLYHEFFFRLDSGFFPWDGFLKYEKGKTVTWQVDYAGSHYKGNFTNSNNVKFCTRKNPKEYLSSEQENIDAITFFINGPENKRGKIKFTNIRMRYW